MKFYLRYLLVWLHCLFTTNSNHKPKVKSNLNGRTVVCECQLPKKYRNRQWWSDELRNNHPYVPLHQFRMWSQYPTVIRDVTVPKNNESDFIPFVVTNAGKYLETAYKTNEFKNKLKHTVTFRLVFQSMERTLSKKEIDDTILLLENKLKTL